MCRLRAQLMGCHSAWARNLDHVLSKADLVGSAKRMWSRFLAQAEGERRSPAVVRHRPNAPFLNWIIVCCVAAVMDLGSST